MEFFTGNSSELNPLYGIQSSENKISRHRVGNNNTKEREGSGDQPIAPDQFSTGVGFCKGWLIITCTT